MKNSYLYLGALLVATSHSAATAAPPVACLIEPSKIAEVGSPVVGVLQDVLVERGAVVKAGQPVAQLRDDVERASVQVAEARARAPAEVRAAQAALDFAIIRLNRSKDLFEKKLISAQALDQARTEEQVARQQLARAREQSNVYGRELGLARQQLDQRIIRSPIDGVVVESYLHAGERVEDKPVARVATIDPLRVELIVPASYIGRINSGDTLAVKPEFEGAKALSARVVLLDRVIDAASNTFRVRADLPNPGNAIPAGLRCRVDINAIVAGVPGAAFAAPAATPAAVATAAPAMAAAISAPAAKATLPAARPALAAAAPAPIASAQEAPMAYMGLSEIEARMLAADFKGPLGRLGGGAAANRAAAVQPASGSAVPAAPARAPSNGQPPAAAGSQALAQARVQATSGVSNP